MNEPEPGELSVEYTDLVPVFHGSYAEVMTLRSALDAHGLTTFVPSENMKVMDPFVTGASALTLSLVAPVGEAEEVRAVIAELRPADAKVRMSTPRERRGWWLLMLLMYAPLFVVVLLARLVVGGLRRLTNGPGGTPPDDDATPGSSPGA